MSEKKVYPRVDNRLKKLYPSLSSRHIDEAIESALVRKVNGDKLKKGDKTESEFDCSLLDLYLKELRSGNPTMSIAIIYETAEWLVIDKPAGTASHPISLFDKETVTNWAFVKYPQISKEFTANQPTLCPHRLDTGTSGLLIVTKNRKSYEEWRSHFEKKEVEKVYHAWCWGNPSKENWTVDFPIAHALGTPGKMVAVLDAMTRYRDPIQDASSSVKVIERRNHPKDMFLAEITSRSGVTHQIRVHLAACGFPLLGDSRYDPLFKERILKQKFHQLRAVELSLGDLVIRVSTPTAITA